MPIRIRRFLTLFFALAQLAVLAGGPAVDVMLHASAPGADSAADVTDVGVPDWSCGYCVLQATPGAVVIPATAFAIAATTHATPQSFHTGVLLSSSTPAAHAARAPPTV